MMKRCAVILLVLMLGVQMNAQKRTGAYDNRFPETTIQYIPNAMELGLGLCGVQSERGFGDRALELGMAWGIQGIAVNLVLKNVVKETRPDGRSDNSFPSGHTATAFLGAELVRREYGWGWGAGAYAAAAATGVLRVYHQRHWWWDVCAGAAIGVLCADAGYLLVDPLKRMLGIEPKGNLAFSPTVDPVTGTMCASLSYRF